MNAPIFATLGCRLNAYETEAMKELAAAAGLQGAVVVNTCAVTAEAVRKAKQEIRRLARENPGAAVIVTGCAAQTEPDTFAAMPEVTRVIGNQEKMQAGVWQGLAVPGQLAPDLIGVTEKVQVDDIMSVRETAGHLIDGFGRHRAYVQVKNGCDHRCTFCIIPYGRGNSRSVPAGVVVEQIKRLVGNGFLEVVLTGVDLTSWRGYHCGISDRDRGDVSTIGAVGGGLRADLSACVSVQPPQGHARRADAAGAGA